jgi:hypothetical protein
MMLRLAVAWIVLLGFARAEMVRGEVTNVSGTATATVVQYRGVVEVQRDFSQESVPGTNATPPATGRARLDHLLDDGTITAAGQVVALLDQPNMTGLGNPNDAGLDLGAFSDDSATSWYVEGAVTETRTLVLKAGDLGGDLRFGNRGRVRSHIVLSGAMLVLAASATQDLSEVEVRLRIQVTQRTSSDQLTEVLGGTIALVGGPDGSIEVVRGPGAFAGVSPQVVDLAEVIPELPLVRAVVFTGLQLPYEYEAVAGEPFDLELSTETLIQTTPGGTGAAATFGTPQEGLASVLQRVKQSDMGQRLTAALAEKVDTTGAAYAETDGSGNSALADSFPVCGMMSMEIGLVAPVLAGCWLSRVRARRRRS